MREDYYLSDETREILTDRVKPIASEMDVDQSFLYAILRNKETDVFAKFKRMYAACVRAGAPVCLWDNALAAIRERYAKTVPTKEIKDCLIEKMQAHTDTVNHVIEALKDGELSEAEQRKLQTLIDRERQNLDLLEVNLRFQERPISLVAGKNR